MLTLRVRVSVGVAWERREGVRRSVQAMVVVVVNGDGEEIEVASRERLQNGTTNGL